MEKLSLKSYVWKCVLGGEIAYVLCLLGGYIPWRSEAAVQLHHRLIETLPGVVWGDVATYFLGAVYIFVFSWVFGSYMVWMHNSSLVKE